MEEKMIKSAVREYYSKIALSPEETKNSGCCDTTPACCEPDDGLVSLVDYGGLNQQIPTGANLGLGCGIPVLAAELKPGEVVLDLGSGAGVDVFLAANAVGQTGKVIGVDMTPEMIARARNNAIKSGYTNVEFRQGEIEKLPVDDNSVDVVISNCVINLATDKRQVFAEIYRALKIGGRIVISDIVSLGEVPKSLRSDPDLWSCCLGGALDRDEYVEIIQSAGFKHVQLTQSVDPDLDNEEPYKFISVTVKGNK